jgi:hypothetical protein
MTAGKFPTNGPRVVLGGSGRKLATTPEGHDDTVSPLGVGWLLLRESKPANSSENVGRGGAANRPPKRTIKT